MFKKLAQSIGIASLVLAINYGDLLGGGADVRMHAPRALTAICLAQIADVLLLGLLLFAVLALLQRTRAQKETRLYRWVRLLLAIVIPPYLIERTQSLFPFVLIDGLVPILALIWTALLLLLMLQFPLWYKRVMQAASLLCAFFAVFAAFSIAQLLWTATWKPGPQERTASWETGTQPLREHPLLVWIVFDELSYDQVFEHRARDLNLPNFDALRNVSTTYTDVEPAGYHTAEIIPSLLSGQPVEAIRYSFANKLRVHATGQHGFTPLDGAGTVFGAAQRQGWRTAAVGWYNPYCTLYGDALEQCYWTNWDKIDGPMAQHDSFLQNTWAPLAQLVHEVRSPAAADRDLCNFDVRTRLETHKDLEHHMLEVLHTDQADFVFLHLAVPHSPNIWSRIRDNYTSTCDSSYLDNLALADRELGKVMTLLQASPRWKDTTLVVEGDHSWRIAAWNWLPAWTDEDDAASRGVFDSRPALLVHAAGQVTAKTESQPWPLIQVHGVVEKVLGQTHSSQSAR